MKMSKDTTAIIKTGVVASASGLASEQLQIILEKSVPSLAPLGGWLQIAIGGVIAAFGKNLVKDDVMRGALAAGPIIFGFREIVSPFLAGMLTGGNLSGFILDEPYQQPALSGYQPALSDGTVYEDEYGNEYAYDDGSDLSDGTVYEDEYGNEYAYDDGSDLSEFVVDESVQSRSQSGLGYISDDEFSTPS